MAHAKFGVLTLVLVFLMGCSTVPLTEQEIYEREDRRNLIIEQHQIDIMLCEKAKGVMVYRRWSASRIKRPLSIFEMKTSQCVSGQEIIDEMRRLSI